MRAEKKTLTREYLGRLNSSPFFLVVDYRGLSVAQFKELRTRLRKSGAEIHVVKNSVFRIAVKEANLADLTGVLAGQLAVVTGLRDASAAAKVLKTYESEVEKPKLQFGYLGNQRFDRESLMVLAQLPPIEVLRGKLLGVLQAPASQLARLLSTPASQLARVLQARVEKGV